MDAKIYDTITRNIDNWIKKNYPNGLNIYKDYGDTMEESTMAKILDSKNPLDKFYETIFEQYDDYDYTLRQEAWKECLADIQIEDDQDLFEHFSDNITINYPFDDFLDQEFCVNIIIDNGDADTDFSMHTCWPHYNSRRSDNLARKSGLAWLAATQGYSIENFRKQFERIKNKNSSKNISPFVYSCYQEIANETSSLNCLTFLVKMTAREILGWTRKKTAIKISKDTTVGLIDFWNGAGSLLEIQLEKDITLDPKYIFRLNVNEYWRFNLYNIYGLCDNAWKSIASIAS